MSAAQGRSIRRLFMSTMIRAIALASLAVGIPSTVWVWWVTDRRHDLLDSWIERSAGLRAIDLAVATTALTILGVTVAFLAARTSMARVVRPLEELSAQAETLISGEDLPRGHETTLGGGHGIAEVDQLATALIRGAREVSLSLTAERTFASDASHQLRTPLTALLMRLEEIASTDDLDVAREEAAIAIAQVERLGSVVSELLQRRRHAPDLVHPEVSLDSILASMQREWQPAFETARRSVRVHGERGLMVKATPVALGQVFSTLMENSLVHGRGTVGVHVRRSGPSVVVEVCDEGEGVPAAVAPHIFERSVSTGGSASTGLGLALARDLAESFGGRLDLIVREPATFAVFLSEAGNRYPVRVTVR